MDKSSIFKVLPPDYSSLAIVCGVCKEWLAYPPTYSCTSATFICGACFDGYRYYLNDDDLRAADYPVRQILYENYAEEMTFQCTFYPFCKDEMYFGVDAELHYKEYCLSKVLPVFRCPISKANRMFLPQDTKYCSYKYSRIILYEDENAKMTKHILSTHSEFILERPHLIQLRQLKNASLQRQIFLLLLDENSIIAVIMTELTKNEIIFRCRVNDTVDHITAKADPYQCCITLVPSNERFDPLMDLNFECVPFDSKVLEYPWQSIRIPLRHLVEETIFRIYVLPRSFMLRSIPYLHRSRQLFESAEETAAENTLITNSETSGSNSDTLSNADSNKTEIISLPSSSSSTSENATRRTIIEMDDAGYCSNDFKQNEELCRSSIEEETNADKEDKLGCFWITDEIVETENKQTEENLSQHAQLNFEQIQHTTTGYDHEIDPIEKDFISDENHNDSSFTEDTMNLSSEEITDVLIGENISEFTNGCE